MLRRHPLLALLALTLLGSAHALDAAGLAPALERAFPPSVAYLDCPFQSAARTCVLVPGAANVRAGTKVVLDALRALPGVEAIDRAAAGRYTFRAGDTAYRLHVAPSRARPGMVAATLSFTFDGGSATPAVCLRPNALFDFARLPALTQSQYAAMATAVTCHGADPIDTQGRTPLWDAVASGNLTAVRTLLRGGADPNHIADDGWTPLLVAGKEGSRPVLDALLQAGGDPTYVAPDGATLASLEPFNRRLGAAPSDAPGGDAVLPERPGTLPGGPMPLPAAASGNKAPVPASGSAAAVPVSGRASSSSASGAPSPVRAGLAPAAASGSSPSPRARGRHPGFPWLPSAVVLVAVGMVLIMMRLRAASEPPDSLTDTGTEWRALARSKPLSRQRRPRRLEPARPWNDPLA